MRCWGGAADGELGDGIRAIRMRPGPVALPEPAVELGIGDKTVCARLQGGGSHCWGYLPPNNNTPTPTPSPLSPPGRLTIGYDHVCGVVGGGAQCYGLDYMGQLGNDTGGNSATPAAVVGLSNVTSIASWGFSSCAIANGGVSCSGGNQHSNLGDGTTTNRQAPVAAGSFTTAAEVSISGRLSCVRLASGAVSCWGNNQQGETGTGVNGGTVTTPTAVVASFGSANELSVGGRHACIRASTNIWCWGRNNEGQIGDGSYADTNVAAKVPGFTGSKISAGENHTCAIAPDASVWCWGFNGDGQLGDGTVTGRTSPTRVVDLEPTQQVVTGNHLTCALTTTGEVRFNTTGQLGDGLPAHGSSPRLARVYCR